MIQSIASYQPDVLIQIPLDAYGPLHFYKSEKIIDDGKFATQIALKEFEVKKK